MGLRSAGVEVIAYDSGHSDSPFAPLIQRRAQEAGVPLAASMAHLVEASDLLLAAVPGSVAMQAATEAAKHLKPARCTWTWARPLPRSRSR